MATVSRTCQSCANSKVRCIRNVDNPHVCNRCLRLGRECIYRQTGRRFHGFQKDRRIEALESRVKELLTDRAASADISKVQSERETSTRSVSIADDEDGSRDVVDQGFLSMETAQSYLDAFRTVMTPHFPFVVIPPDVSAHQLRQDKPFLFLAVLSAASYENMPLQRSLGAEVKKAVSSRMILNGEISFDLLQGLLVFLAWSHYHTKPHRYTQYLQLAISLIIELRLDRAPQTRTWKTGLSFQPDGPPNRDVYDRPSWGNDEKRAIIGCYYLSSSIAILLQKYSTFPYVTYIEICCQSLHQDNEYPHDKYITHIVQLQHIAEKIDRLSADHGEELVRPGSGAELYVTNVKNDLSNFHKRLPFNLFDSSFLAFHFHATGLCLYQLALGLTDEQPRSPFGGSISQRWREELSCAAVNAAESIIGIYTSLPPASELGFTNTQWIQMAFAMLIGYRHTAASEDPENIAAFLRTLTQLRQRVGALSTPNVDHNGDRDVFCDFRKRIVQIQSRLERGKKDDTPSSGIYFDRSMEASTQFVSNPGITFQEPDSVEWQLPQDEMLVFMEDYRLPDDFLLNTSVEQVMNSWI
ncbi:hypothetical protein N7532_011393 [Penicillium argentinense]|uniref:Zn(2)-C6 fungal-type domain-containing protein n=1 Tax=Penicillium argentinense TaxID=1131581 RepID=A0A9W9JUX3_9EURO|nr:uncharacterized protein N7532_011393 [Penicillium argentinense]KAJ5082350.1 hypothetical protein N7532_011393 [Penicillium argentinense]